MKTFYYDKNRAGMTLVEIMIVVLIIALLAAIAIPSFINARNTTQNNIFINSLRVCANAFEQYSLETGGFPPDTAPGVVPVGMEDYLIKTNWTDPTPLGGEWDWARDIAGVGTGIRAYNPTGAESRFQDIDDRLDDGDLSTGLFRKLIDGSGYIYIVE